MCERMSCQFEDDDVHLEHDPALSPRDKDVKH